MADTPQTAEQARLDAGRSDPEAWRRWGTYLSERAWGTVREDYSADGDAWNNFPFEHARSRAYRWNEDGLAGWCDRDQTICLGLALWNGKDPILKERPFGLTNAQGNHGEDAKDYWFYVDNVPSHAYASMVYKYPQARFPYEDLVATNGRRSPKEFEYELFEALRPDWEAGRYFDVFVEYAKATPEDLLCRITVTNRGPDPAEIHVLPHLWYRNTWTWTPDGTAPSITPDPGAAAAGAVTTTHPDLGQRWCWVRTPDDSPVEWLFCENETNAKRLWGGSNAARTAKDGIGDAVVLGDRDAVDPTGGSKAAAHTHTTLAPGASWVLHLRFAPENNPAPFDDADSVIEARRKEADEFYDLVHGPKLDADQRLVQRQALAGLLWCKQFYHYGVARWLEGDPGQPAPPASRWQGRNHDWKHFLVADVMLMPDAWEYPWFAEWDLAFHCAAIALIDPAFAKDQILLLLSARCQHPYGQVPAYEWNFGDTNPPLLPWAAWNVYRLDAQFTGEPDRHFLAEVNRAVSLEAMWWLNQQDQDDRGLFAGGFLGMDNIGVFDRDQALPTGGRLAQVDGTAWVASMVLHLLAMAVELGRTDSTQDRMVQRWTWDFLSIANALYGDVDGITLWDDEDGFYHDVLELPGGKSQPLGVFSMQGLVPLLASLAVPSRHLRELANAHMLLMPERIPPVIVAIEADSRHEQGDGVYVLLGILFGDRLRAVLTRLLDPEQFLSDYGVRSLSRQHLDHPYEYRVGGADFEVRYLPAESDNRMFGGNSNWRGPIWMPLNLLLVQALDTYGRFYGDTYTVECPTGSGHSVGLSAVADELATRLTRLFVRDEHGRRAVFGGNETFQNDPHWRDLVPFHEYFHGDNGAGLGASHQTGWTATVALLLARLGADHAS